MNYSTHTASGDGPHSPAAQAAQRKSLCWRVHGWAALITLPLALIATLTGILYIFTPQIEAYLYSRLDRVEPQGAMLALDDSIAAAKRVALHDWSLHSVTLPFQAGDTVKVNFVPPVQISKDIQGHNHHLAKTSKDNKALSPNRPTFGLPAQSITVYVNPYTADVVGQLANADRFNQWAKRLHSRLLQNDNWRWLIELAASGMVVLLLSGIYLWWPYSTSKVLPPRGAKGRLAWKHWHGFVGVAFALMSCAVLTTGLTWSRYAGEQVRSLRDAIGQAPPRVPHDLKSTPLEGVAPLTWQAVWDLTRKRAPDIMLQLKPARTEQGTWHITVGDRSQAMKRFDWVLDAYTGQTLYYSAWEQQTVFAKATAIGIIFHRGEFGWWNQALLLLFGLSVLFSLTSGWVMFWKRRKPKTLGLVSVHPNAWKTLSWSTWVLLVFLLCAMPLLVFATAVVGLVELVLFQIRRGKSKLGLVQSMG